MASRLLRERINPAIHFCRLFGLGLLHSDSIATRIVDMFLLFVNFVVCLYSYFHITSLVSEKMPDIWDITTVVSVIRLYIRIFSTPLIIILSQFQKRTLTRIICEFDNIVPGSIEPAFLWSFVFYSVVWLLGNIVGECLTMVAFHVRTKFEYFSFKDVFLIVIFNFWMFVPLLQYLFMIKAIRLGVQNINDSITSMEQWKLLRLKWKELGRLSIHLTSNVVGEIILTYMVCKIADIIFFIFLIYFYGYKEGSKLVMSLFLINVCLEVVGVFELFRQCNICKLELLKTHTVLNSVNINTKSDYRQLKFASLYMLHTDFKFMPCGIFEMNYRNFVTVNDHTDFSVCSFSSSNETLMDKAAKMMYNLNKG
ncbi:Hypothetical protein CINCED_3A004912 [Cinara cedri]|uniref:Gustatory receptor n=1 Tax=Cinara cedri TaxID=506608 RepID=A0A5E4MM02_9HEMI|nr:Hypothetical protein CINCED_3A004912 [Cinara cedri]